MIVGALLAIALSGALLIALGARDPKRLRNARHVARGQASAATRDAPTEAAPFSAALRRTFGWLSLAPGIVLAVLGESWAFLVWLGAITAIGWAIAITAGYSSVSVWHRSQS